MNEEYCSLTEIVKDFRINTDLLQELEMEEIICPVCCKTSGRRLVSQNEVEKLRLAVILFEEMDVNVPGIEVILQMRQNMLDMRKQFDAILEDLARRLRERLEPE